MLAKRIPEERPRDQVVSYLRCLGMYSMYDRALTTIEVVGFGTVLYQILHETSFIM